LTTATDPQAWEADRVRRHLLALENRQRLADHVERNPGVHLRRIARDLGLAIGTTEHHLHLLVRHGVLERRDQGGHSAYFAKGRVGPSEQHLLCALRHDTPRRILRALAADPDLAAPDLAARLGLSRSAVMHHLARLVAEGLVERLRVGRSSLLKVRDPAALAKALAVHDRSHPVLPWPGFRPAAVPLPSNSRPPGEALLAQAGTEAV
jgi:predicted transcriptional regulator